MTRRTRRSFTSEQRAAAVVAARTEGNVSRVARDLDISPSLLRTWIKQAEVDERGGSSGALTSNERDELNRLRRRCRTLEQERDFLKKAAAFFAKESDPRTR
jgi:transposase-like protein